MWPHVALGIGSCDSGSFQVTTQMEVTQLMGGDAFCWAMCGNLLVTTPMEVTQLMGGDVYCWAICGNLLVMTLNFDAIMQLVHKR
jgi:hypothetical protein